MLGEIIKERYQVVQILSSSSYCQTYLAHDISQNPPTPCVIKHLLPANTQTSSMSSLRRLFTREVAALEKLGTYSQVPQLEDDFEENQQFYLVQEYIAGQALSAILLPGVRWNESQVVELLYEVLSILEVVHAHGLIHRDIKPSNLIRRSRDGQLVLIDFGSVKQAWTQVVTSHGQTNANYAVGIPATVAIGTPGYMPSEQSRGRPRPNSDIYALGMVAIQALTGMQPTLLLEDAETGEVIWQHLAAVSPELAAIINQMVRYHFSDRYQSATEVLASLQPLVALYAPHKLKEPAVTTATNSSKPLSRTKTNQTTKSRKRANVALWLGIAIGVTSALGLILGIYWAMRPGKNVSPSMSPEQLTSSSSSLPYSNVSVAHTLTDHTDAVWALAISRDGQTLVSGSEDNTIKVWNLKTGQPSQTLSGHTDTVRSVALSPDGQTLASGSADNTIKVWNLYTSKLLGTLKGHRGSIWSVAISPDGRTLISGGEDGINLWNLQTGEIRQTLQGHQRRVFSVAFSPDGLTCATGGIDKTINIWNVETGKQVAKLEGHTDAVRDVVFSPDGQKLASGSWDKTIKIWNWQTGKQLHTLNGHKDRVIGVAFSPDGKSLASASNDQTIKIWNVQTGSVVRSLVGHKDWVLAIATSPTDNTLVSSSKDKTIKIWQ